MTFEFAAKANRNNLVTIATTCFLLVVASGILSLFGLVDAFLAADLLIFEALSDMHSAVFGLLVTLIASIGFTAALLAARNDRLQAANSQLPANYAAATNLKLDAERIQAMLHVLQYPVRIDGVFGPETAKVVREFQHDQDLLMDGVVGPLTLEALQKQVEAQGRTDWVSEIIYRQHGPRASTAPVLSLIGARRTA